MELFKKRYTVTHMHMLKKKKKVISIISLQIEGKLRKKQPQNFTLNAPIFAVNFSNFHTI